MAVETVFAQRQPRYVTLAEDLTRAIRDGLYPIGSLLPAEPELCRKYEVGRHTLREAVRLMREMGLVRTRQGHGTRVESSQISSSYVLSMDAVPDLWQYAESSALKVGRKRTIAAGDALVVLPEVEARARWCQIEAMRYSDDGKPLAWKHVYIDGAYENIVDAIGKQRVPIYSLIERQYGIRTSRIHHRMGAETVPDVAAEALGMKKGTPGFRIVREYYDASGRLFEATVTIYPPDRLQYSFDLVLAQGSQNNNHGKMRQ